jgi:glycosyltransferase involved in cell wall biosynthesis
VDVVFVGFLLGHGGDALQMLALAKGIKSRGARVKVIVPAVQNSVIFKERCDIAGVDCERSDLITADMHGSRQHLRSVLTLFRSVDAPIVHFHTGNSCLPRSVMVALEVLRSRRAFVTLQSPYETISPGSGRARFWAVTARRRLHAVVSPSEHGTRFQERCGLPAHLAVTVRNSIDVAAMAEGDATEPRALLGVDPDTPLIVFSSRIDAQKRPADAVRIFSVVAHEFPTALLVFVGGGQEETAVVNEAVRLGLGDRVRLVGYQTNVADWLAAATVWILPTERENFSVAVLEALAAGCPVLATSCPGNDEILEDGRNALTFAVGDVEAGAIGLRKLLSDGALRGNLSRAAFSSAEGYSVDSMTESYRVVYNRAAVVPECLRS